MTLGTHQHLKRCRAHRSNGDACSAFPIHGGTVCVVHGGRAPQVKAKAEERIRDMVDPALNRLLKLIDDDSSGVALGAVKDVLDRAGYVAKQQVEITMRQRAKDLADDLGIPIEELLAEAERIVGNNR